MLLPKLGIASLGGYFVQSLWFKSKIVFVKSGTPNVGSPNDIFKIEYFGLGSVFSKRDESFPNIQSFRIL